MSNLYVGHVGPIIVGPPKRSNHISPFLQSIPEVKVEPLSDFLANLTTDEKRFLSNGIVTHDSVTWEGRVFARGTIRQGNIDKIIVPMINEGKIPDELDFVELQHLLGVYDHKSLELALFELLKDVGEHGIKWDN